MATVQIAGPVCIVSTPPFSTSSPWRRERRTRFHGVADEGVPTREIAEVIGRRLHLPARSLSIEEAASHFGWVARVFSLGFPASSTLTQTRLGWLPAR